MVISREKRLGGSQTMVFVKQRFKGAPRLGMRG